MKILSTLAFGAIALTTANFATAAPAAASNVGFYAGSNGFAIQVNNYNRRACWDYWYRRYHPYECGYARYYNPGYYDNDWRFRFHRRHRDRDWDDRRWRDRDHDHDRWRDRNRDHDRDRRHR